MPKPKKKSLRFSPGDRVITKPNLTVVSNAVITGQGRSMREPKHGTVTGIVYKTNKRGVDHPYVEVQWDGSGRSDLHAANRLWFESDEVEQTKNYRQGLG